MGVSLLAVGSRGDVQPLAVLAAALQREGVPVRVIALAEYRAMVEGLGATFVPIQGRFSDCVVRGPVWDQLGRTSPGQLALLRRWTARLADATAEVLTDTVDDGDVVITGFLARGAAAALTQVRRVRMATVTFTAQSPTLCRESYYFPWHFTGWERYDRWGTKLNWVLATGAGSAVTRRTRARLGLPPKGAGGICADADRHPTIVAASPILVPPAPDWPAHTHQTGWLAPPEPDFTVDPELSDFLAGEPPVYVGYGSFTWFATDRESELITAAAARSGRRVVTPALPGRRPGPLSDRVLSIDSVPHGWLFPRTAGVIHHGGAGTTHTGLRSGVPSVAMPFGVDQPYHAWRLHQLGAGPKPVSVHRLSAHRLAALITELADGPRASRYAARAGELAERSLGEDGTAATVATLDRLGLLS